MMVSITGLLRNAANDILRRASVRDRQEIADELKRLAWMLWTLSGGRAEGEGAIDIFFASYLVRLPLQRALGALPVRPTRDIPQPRLTRFGLSELHRNLLSVQSRKAEGRAVLDEFFAAYVFEGEAPEEIR